MWRELIHEYDLGAKFEPPASAARLQEIERALKINLPNELKNLLSESDGILCEDGQHLIWSIEEMRQRNSEMWTHETYRNTYMPLDTLLFFSDAGVDGICFGFPIIAGAVSPRYIYAWYPIEDSRPCVAISLKHYLECWLTGRLKI